MDISEKNRLIKIVGMLGSAADGERANAAAMLDKVAREKKITMTQLLALVAGNAPVQERVIYKDRIVEKEKVVYRDRPQPQTPPPGQQGFGPSAFGYQQNPSAPPPDPDPEPAGFTDIDSPLLARLKECAVKPTIAGRVLSPWEMSFCQDVSERYQYDTQLSDKQLVVVQKILVKASRLFQW